MISPPSTVKNQQLWRKHCRKVRALAQRITVGKVGVIEGSRQMLTFRQWLHAWDDGQFDVFEMVNQKSIGLPLGEVRLRWDADALKTKDEEIRSVEDAYRKKVIEAAKRVWAKFS